jgi:hypothetical protein
MEDRDIIESLMEGGNSFAGKKRVIHTDPKKAAEGKMMFTSDDKGETDTKAKAEKMDMTRINRTALKKAFIDTFKKLNDAVKKETGKPLWNDFGVVQSGLAFNGSSTWMFRDEISDDEFTTYKKKVGDIDITVPADRMIDLFNVLLKLEDKKLGEIEYLGNNRENPSDKQQINAVFKYHVPGSDYVAYPQVDFEPSDYENDKPTEWDSFSHNSDWADIQKGFKGVTHKYAMTIVAHIISKDLGDEQIMHYLGLDELPEVDKKKFYITTETNGEKLAMIPSSKLPSANHGSVSEEELSTIFKSVTGKTMNKILSLTGGVRVSASHFVSFSVGKGVRVKYKPALTSDGKPFIIDGQMVLVEVKPANATYEKNLKPIFRLFFGSDPSDADLKKMNSFVGVIELLKSMDLPHKKEYYAEFLDDLVKEKLWGHPPYFPLRSQELERDSKETDSEIKWAMVNYIMKELGTGNLNELKAMSDSYYASWEGKATDDIRESFIPFGSKFSHIFEAVSNAKKL